MRAPEPVWVAEVELADRLEDLRAPAASSLGLPYGAARVLVRLHGRALGAVSLSLDDGVLRADAVREAARRELGEALASHLEADGLTLEGLDRCTAPPCLGGEAPATALMSAVVCTRDRPELLGGALASLLGASPALGEVVVVDSASRDDSARRVVEAAGDSRVRYVREPRGGLARARNAGARAARGTLLAFTDDDVVVDVRWPDRLARALAHDARVACVTGPVLAAELETPAQLMFDAHVRWGEYVEPRVFNLDEARSADRLFPYGAGLYGTGANFACTAEALRAIGGFDEALGAGRPARGGEDLDFFLRIVLSGRWLAHEPGAVVWHLHGRDRRALAGKLFGYGVGMGAIGAKHLAASGSTLPVAARLPRAFVRFARGRPRAQRLPVSLRLVQMSGLAAGPLAYARSRRRLAREREELAA